MSNTNTEFYNFLNGFEQQDWTAALAELLPSIHEVDRNATQIWFKFYPLELFRALEEAPDRARLIQQLVMQGNYRLADQIDTSHTFLFGHRYWPDVREAVSQRLKSFTPSADAAIVSEVNQLAEAIAGRLRLDPSLLAGITAVALMTLVQVGPEEFAATRGTVHLDSKHAKLSPEKVLAARAKDDSQGPLGFLRTVNKQWSVCYDENNSRAHYKIMDEEELASAAARDRSREWTEIDARRTDGPIPVECRSAACGTCWVGVLGGAEKLADVGRREGTRIKEFGYDETSEPKPLIRLACQAQTYGTVSIVIPPWNAQFGKFLRRRATGEADPLQPAEASQNAAAK